MLQYQNNIKSKSAFSLIELSIVLIVIGLVVSGVIAGKKLIESAKLTAAKSATKSSIVGSMEDLILWLDATSIDITDSNQVRIDGSDIYIKEWQDISPISDFKNDVEQTSNAKQPAYNKNGLNGLPSLNFDGADSIATADNMINSSFPLSDSMSFFIVAKINEVTTSTDSLIAIDENINNIDFQLDANSGGQYLYRAKTSGSLHNGINSGIDHVGGTHLFGYSLNHKDSSSQAVEIFVDGVQVNSTGYGNRFAHNSAILRIGSNRVNNSGIGAEISEVIIFKDALSNTERQAVEDYLMDKWDITS